VVTNPLQPLSFKTEQLKPALDCTVSLLVDNSGSMRGQPIRQAALAADMIAAILSLAGVEFEVLGFTTSGFRGGNSYKKWVAAGRPANPGRLCDLLQGIEVSAIGLNYDISHFYPKSLRLDNPESVPELLLESLTGLLAR
jgi:cobalamin biosynthesis protein CobT